MSDNAASDAGVSYLGFDCLTQGGSTRVRDLVLDGFETSIAESPSELVAEWEELVKCFAVQIALEEEISYLTHSVTSENLYQRGYDLLSTTSANEMASYLSSKNPLFWNEMVAHNKELDLLLV